MNKSIETIMETTINYIRDVLRKEGITGMESINHCIVFVLCRMLDKETCKKTKIDEKYAYENIMIDEDGDEIGDQELYGRIFVKGKECLITEFINKLQFRNIKFKLEGIQNVKSIMKKMKKFNPKQLSNVFDIIGTIYEIHLKSGTSSSMRDLGQYYTNRLIINYMIKLCDPKMVKGIIEKIVDPTMGTGGFLTMVIKFLNEKYGDKIDWAKNKSNIIGFDIDENVRNMALLNVFLECGELMTETIYKQDTLHNDLKFADGTILNKAKVILANEPMGLKNIIFTSCCDRIKTGLKAGTKAEPLFMNLFMEALDDDGRCAVIVPDGMLFNDSNLHNKVREKLIEKFNVKKIVALSDDFFLNTGVKTSIIYFVNDGEKTKEIEFSYVKLNNGAIQETSIIKVKYDDLKKNNYSLFVNKYNVQVIEKVGGVEYKKLGDVCKMLSNGKRKSSEGKETGKYPLYYCSILGNLWMDEYDYNEEGIIINTTNGSGKCQVYYCEKEYSVAESTVRFCGKNDNVITKYLYYYLKINKHVIENMFRGSNQKQLSRDDLITIEIPIPSLAIQKQIVEALDILSNNNETCKKYIEETTYILKKYIELNSKGATKKLGEMCDTKSGKFNSQDKKETGKYPFYTSDVNSPCGFSDDFCFDYKEYLILIKDGGAGQGKYGEQIGLGKVFKIKGKSCATSHQYAVIIKDDCKEIMNDYLYLFLMTKKNQIMDLAMYTTGLGCIRKSDFDDLNIEYPSIEKQKEIICFCDEMMKNIEYAKKQINNNANLMKNIIASFLTENKGDKHKKEESEIDSESSSSESEKEDKTKIKDKKIIKKVSKKEKSETKTESDTSNSSSEDEKPVKKVTKKKN